MDGRPIPLNKTLPRDLCPGGSRRTRPMTRTILSYPMLRLSRLPLRSSSPFLFANNLDRRLSPSVSPIRANQHGRAANRFAPFPVTAVDSPFRPSKSVFSRATRNIRSIRRIWTQDASVSSAFVVRSRSTRKKNLPLEICARKTPLHRCF